MKKIIVSRPVAEIIRRKAIRDKKPVRFNIKFLGRKEYISIYIWGKRGDMYLGAALEDNNYAACYIPYIDKGGNKFGEIHFHTGFLGVGAVAHELLHAIFDMVYKNGYTISPPSPTERANSERSEKCEWLCSELENLTRRFWNKYYKFEDRIKNLR